MLLTPLVAASIVCLVFASISRAALADEPLARQRYPLAKTDGIRLPAILLDSSAVSGNAAAEAWGKQAQQLCQEWFPVICLFLATDNWTALETVQLVLNRVLKAPGATSGATIQISVDWITRHPDDFGMVIHELTHVIQNYPPNPKQPGWLVEGIADYIRYWKYEPRSPGGRIDFMRASYRNGYGITAAFLAWIVWKHDNRIIRRLDESLRTGKYTDELFEETTGKNLDALWAEFVASQKPS